MQEEKKKNRQRPSVLFVNRVYPPTRGATGRVLRDLAKTFAKKGWQVTILTTGETALRERDGQIKVIRIQGPNKPRLGMMYLWVWLKLLYTALFKVQKIQLVVSMTDPPLAVVIGHIYARWKGARHIHWCQDLYPDILPVIGVNMPKMVYGFFSGMSIRALKKASRIVVIGRCMAERLKQKGIDAKNISVIPNWPDSELCVHLGMRASKVQAMHIREQESEAETAAGQETWRSHEDQLKTGPKFRVLYAGNIGKAHAYEPMLDVAKALQEPHPEIEFVFVGEGPRFDEIAKFRAENNLENIRLLPYQPNSRLREVMESGDVHVISMKDEAVGCLVPSKMYSALAVARPSIFMGPDESEVAITLRDFEAGISVPANDAQGLLNAVMLYRNDGEAWFKAHQGALEASKVFVAKESTLAFNKRAYDIVAQE